MLFNYGLAKYLDWIVIRHFLMINNFTQIEFFISKVWLATNLDHIARLQVPLFEQLLANEKCLLSITIQELSPI